MIRSTTTTIVTQPRLTTSSAASRGAITVTYAVMTYSRSTSVFDRRRSKRTRASASCSVLGALKALIWRSNTGTRSSCAAARTRLRMPSNSASIASPIKHLGTQ